MAQGLQHIPLRIPDKWDPKWFELFIRDVLAMADVRNASGDGIEITGQSDNTATLTVSQDIQDLLQQTFVLAAPSGFLNFERTLAGEDGIVEIVDGGPNSTITVTLATNGVPLGKLALLTQPGLLGNKFLTDSQPGLITPANAGQAITFNGTTLDWTDTPTWAGTHRWPDGFGVIFGSGDDLLITHDGTDAHWQNITGDTLIESTTFTVATTAAEFQIDADGAWLLDGDPGTAGQVPTSAGTGAPVFWADASGGGGGNVTPDTHPSSPDAMDDEFEAGSLNAKWSWINQNGASVAFADGSIKLTSSTASAGTNNNALLQAAPGSTPWIVKLKICAYLPTANSGCGLALYNSGNSKMLVFGHFNNSGAAGVYVQRLTNPTTFSANQVATNSGHQFSAFQTAPMYLELENDGTNLNFWWNTGGVSGVRFKVYTETIAAFIGAVTDVGIVINGLSTSTAAILSADWFRRVA